MDEKGTYVNIHLCDSRHADMMRGIEEIQENIKRLHKSIYEDNGNRSIQTILRSHDSVIKTIIWLVGAIAVASIAAVVKLILIGKDTVIVDIIQ